MKSLIRTVVLLVILVIAGFVGLIYLDQTVQPPVTPVEKTISNDSFAQ